MRPALCRHTLLAALAVLVLSSDARAQRADPTTSGAAHAWLVLPDRATDASALVHVPPRRAAEGAVFEPSERGTLRVARRLATAPRAVAAWADDVYLLMPAAPDRPARVLTLTALPAPIGDFWSYEPRTRLRPLDPFPDGFVAQGIVGARDGPAVLGERSGRPALLRYTQGAWEQLALPTLSGAQTLRLLPDAGGQLRLLSIPGAGAAALWTRAGSGWLSVDLAPGIDPDRLIALGATGPRVLAAQAGENAVELLAISESGAERIAMIEGVSDQHAGAFQGDRFEAFVLAWEIAQGESGASAKVTLAEVSTATGQELYRGAAIRTLPVSTTQFRLLAASLVALMGVVLLVVLKPSEEGPVLLPEGCALAEPGRRLAATMVDVLIAVFIVRLIFNVPLIEIITLSGLLRPGGAWMAAPTMLAIGFLLSVTGEWLSGRSLGKLATGCRVVQIRSESIAGPPVRPSLWRAAVRNIVKWALPPVAALALVDPSARHRGDSISGLAVVVPTHDSPVDSGDEP